MNAADGNVTDGTYPQTKEFDGGFCVLELPPREAAVQWAAKCSQELREFQYGASLGDGASFFFRRRNSARP